MTLGRVLEPEVMASPEEAREYDEMDHSAVNTAFVTDLLAAGLPDGVMLDLGCGAARIPIELCERRADCLVKAVDLSIPMLDVARYNIEAASLIDRIALDLIDAKQLPYEDDSFAAVISNSIVHHLAEPIIALREAVRVVAPGGLLFFRDLLRPNDAADVSRLVRRYAGGERTDAQRMFDDSLRAALNLTEIRTIVAALGFDQQSVRATSDRHWTWIARKPA